jgi:hypothetical protein
MVCALGQNQTCTFFGRNDVVFKVPEIYAAPNVERRFPSLVVGEFYIFVKIGSRISKGGIAKTHETINVPVSEQSRIGVEID